jgi:DNA-binding MarR family transcriptional regulator
MPESDNITMNELSVKMRLANSTMTRMVDQLVQKRLVIRETDPQDRRIVLVHLTDKGREERSTFRSTLQDIFSQVLGELSVEEREDVLYSLRSLNSAILKTLNSCCSDEGV